MQSLRSVSVLVLALSFLTSACGLFGPAEDEGGSEVVSPPLGDLNDFQVIELDGDAIAEGLQAGEVTLPFRTRDGQRTDLTFEARRVELRVPDLRKGMLRSGPEEFEPVPLPPERNYRVGPCPEEPPFHCGAITLIGEQEPMVRAMLVHPELGVAYIEPVDLMVEEEVAARKHLIYHTEDSEAIDLTDDIVDLEGEEEGQSLGTRSAPSHGFKVVLTDIVLDGDVSFYNQDPSTVWQRQMSIFNKVAMVMGWVGDGWSLVLDVKGQEVWVANGPSERAELPNSPTVNPKKLFQILTDPGYYLIHPVTNQEFHHMFMGRFVGADFGKAAGIGTPSALGGQKGYNHSVSLALKCGRGGVLCSLKGKFVVMAHELGHIVGGTHGNGTSSGACSPSLMLPGGSPAAKKRSLCFSSANDQAIQAVLKGVFP